MFAEILLLVVAGTLAGFIMGLIPGIHPNMVILLAPLFLAVPEGIYYAAAFIVGLGVANSFSSFIPAIYLGASDDAELLSSYPGHRMLLAGRGHDAVALTVLGGVASVVLTVILLPLIVLVVPAAYSATRSYVWAFLVIIVLFVILSERTPGKKLASMIALSVSGILGVVALGSTFSVATTLFPIFTGLFGVPILLKQMLSGTKVPEQKKPGEVMVKASAGSIISGTAGGLAAGFLPGIGSSIIASLATRQRSSRAFLTTIGAITTADIIISFLAIWIIGNPRSGVAVAISQLTDVGFQLFLFMVFAAIFSAAMAAILTVKFSAILSTRIHKVDYTKISLAVIVFLVAMSAWFGGFAGLLLLAASSALGIFSLRSGIRRGILMGVLIIPTIMFFIS